MGLPWEQGGEGGIFLELLIHPRVLLHAPATAHPTALLLPMLQLSLLPAPPTAHSTAHSTAQSTAQDEL